MAKDKKVKAKAVQQLMLAKLELDAGDTELIVELAEPVPAGKKALVTGVLTIRTVDVKE